MVDLTLPILTESMEVPGPTSVIHDMDCLDGSFQQEPSREELEWEPFQEEHNGEILSHLQEVVNEQAPAAASRNPFWGSTH